MSAGTSRRCTGSSSQQAAEAATRRAQIKNLTNFIILKCYTQFNFRSAFLMVGLDLKFLGKNAIAVLCKGLKFILTRIDLDWSNE